MQIPSSTLQKRNAIFAEPIFNPVKRNIFFANIAFNLAESKIKIEEPNFNRERSMIYSAMWSILIANSIFNPSKSNIENYVV